MESLSTMYTNKTEEKILKEVRQRTLRGYKLIRDWENFIIFQRVKNNKPKSEYIRLTLISEGWNNNTLFYWNLEKSFKPWAYKHNHREGANIKSNTFKANETDKYFKYFEEMFYLI